MPSVYPSRSPASMPAARTVRLARRLAGGMTPAEVARHEGTSEAEILSLLEDERFADLVDYHREERELPEDERERLLIASALAGLQHLADMGDTKALLFLTYEGNRGRHPENRLRRLTPPRTADLPPRFRFFETSEPLSVASPAADAAAPAAVIAKAPSDLATVALDTPEREAWIRRWTLSRQAPLGESGAGADEQRRE